MNDENINLDKFDSSIFDDFSKTKVRTEKSEGKKIPVVMVTGFLGAGKTTFLNHILKGNPSLKIGAIINDFGKINIDSKLISSVSEQTIELSNGCVCCMIGDNGLSQPLNKLANKNSNLDAIIIEASGIAEPYDLLQALRFSGNQYSYFGGNIYLIDAENFDLANEQFPSHFKKCLKSSDIILINKIDLISKDKLSKIKVFIRTLNRRAPIIESVNSQIDPNLLFSWDLKQKENHHEHTDKEKCSKCCHTHNHNSKCSHIHHRFDSIEFTTKKPLDPREFINFLDNLPENTFRIKGFCYFGLKGYEQKFLLQIVGKTIDISAHDWEIEENPETELVIIGSNMNKENIAKALGKLIDKKPEDITPENMMNFERFLL